MKKIINQGRTLNTRSHSINQQTQLFTNHHLLKITKISPTVITKKIQNTSHRFSCQHIFFNYTLFLIICLSNVTGNCRRVTFDTEGVFKTLLETWRGYRFGKKKGPQRYNISFCTVGPPTSPISTHQTHISFTNVPQNINFKNYGRNPKIHKYN